MTRSMQTDPDESTDPDLAALEILTTRLADAIDRVGDNDWAVATPCDDWDLADLVDHVTGGNWFSCQILSGRSAEDAMAHTIDRFAGGSASKHQAVASVHEQFGAFTAPGVLDRSWEHVAGRLGGRQILRLRLHDLIVHTWDIEQTLRPPASVPRGLAEWGLAELADERSSTLQLFGMADEPSIDSDVDSSAETGEETGADSAVAYLTKFGRTFTD